MPVVFGDMRSPLLVLLLGVAALASPAATTVAKPPSKARNCGELSGKEVLGRSGSVRLVQRFQGGGDLYGPYAVQYACVGKAKPRELTSAEGVISSTVVVTKRYAGFGYDAYDNACTKYMGVGNSDCRFRGVVVFDVRSGRAVVAVRDVTVTSLTLGSDSATYVIEDGESVTVPFG